MAAGAVARANPAEGRGAGRARRAPQVTPQGSQPSRGHRTSSAADMQSHGVYDTSIAPRADDSNGSGNDHSDPNNHPDSGNDNGIEDGHSDPNSPNPFDSNPTKILPEGAASRRAHPALPRAWDTPKSLARARASQSWTG